MATKAKVCKTCKWAKWSNGSLRLDRYTLGVCEFPVPALPILPICTVRRLERTTIRTVTANCPCWEAKEPPCPKP